MMEQYTLGPEKLLQFKDRVRFISVLEDHSNKKVDLGKSVVNDEWHTASDQTEFIIEHDRILKGGLRVIADNDLDESLQGNISLKDLMTEEYQYKCNVCGKEFKVTGDFNKHLRVHSGEKPYQCKICGKRCTQNGNLKSHMRSHSGEKPFQCNICGKRFTQNGTLTTHLRIHSGEKPYGCTLCGKGFPRNEHLKLHMRIHTGEKPYVCHICHRGFTTNGNLLRHVKVHSSNGGKRQQEDTTIQHDTSGTESLVDDDTDEDDYIFAEPIVEIFVKEEGFVGLREDSGFVPYD